MESASVPISLMTSACLLASSSSRPLLSAIEIALSQEERLSFSIWAARESIFSTSPLVASVSSASFCTEALTSFADADREADEDLFLADALSLEEMILAEGEDLSD